MKQLSVLIKPVGAMCNLSCTYCFYRAIDDTRVSSTQKMMSKEIQDIVIHRVFDELDEDGIVHFAFQGGEPCIAGLPFFKDFIKRAHELRKEHQTIRFSLQSNGMHFQKDWIAFLKKEHILVGISIDGFEEVHNHARINKQKDGSYVEVLHAYETLREAGIRVNILTVVTATLAKYPKELYQFYQQHHMEYIQLIPCLANTDHPHHEELTPALFSTFYTVIFQEWYKEKMTGVQRSISLFDNIAMMLMDSMPFTCGMIGRCSFQYVIEQNGDVYPCDFYAHDKYCCGNVQTMSLSQLKESMIAKQFLKKQKEPILCATCDVRKFCYGNCKAKRDCFLNEKKRVCAYQEVLSSIIPALSYFVQN